MAKIMCIIKPFIYNQSLYIEDGDEQKIAVEVPLKDLAAGVCALSEQTNIEEVILFNTNNMADGIKEEIEALNILRYGENNINVRIL